MPLVFVYGTLKKGFCNHHVLGKNSKFVSTDTVPGALYFIGHRHYPYALPTLGWATPKPYDSGERIHGEIYSVDTETVRELDYLEGHPHHYTRMEIYTDQGRHVHLYRASDDAWFHAPWVEHIPGGVFVHA